jgi:hypothetical protein
VKTTSVLKTVFISVILIVLSACSSGGKTPTLSPTEGAQMLAGVYTTSISAEDISKLNSLEPNFSVNQGKWKITFTNDGNFTAEKDGQFIANGKYNVVGEKIEVDVDQVCPNCSCSGTIGRYFWALKENQLSFSKIAGVCDAMDLVMTAHAITRQP